MKHITYISDQLLGVDYKLTITNAVELSNLLKSTLLGNGVDYREFNTERYKYREGGEEKEMILPADIYEYQNFFLMEKEDGTYILLDGFRRLLWSKDIPNQDILVRVYSEKDMTDTNILKLLVSLNHTKFFNGIGSYYDRGFALAFYSLTGINLTDFRNTFDGYLRGKEAEYSYSTYGKMTDRDEAANTVVDRITSKNFIGDMRFINDLNKDGLLKMDFQIGNMIWEAREQTEVVFDTTDFLAKIRANDVLMKLIASFRKAVDARGNASGNKMFEMLTKILLGKENEKSFAEREAETKAIIEAMKKDKSWFCYTGNKKIVNYDNDAINKTTKDGRGINYNIKKFRQENGRYPKFKVVVMPHDNELIKEGVYDLEMTGFTKGSHLMSVWEELNLSNAEIVMAKNYFGSNDRYDLSLVYLNNGKGTGWQNGGNKAVLFMEDIIEYAPVVKKTKVAK